MTSEERYLFDLMGYLVVEDVLTAEELHDLNAHLDDYDLWSNHGNDPFHEVWTYEESYLIVGPLHQWDEPFRRLLDHPKMLPYLVELLGPTFRLDISHAILMTKGGGKLHLHGGGTPYKAPTHYHFQDGKICCNLIVISYALRDTGPGEGGFAGVPGSHKSHFPLPEDFKEFRTTGPWLQQVPIKAGSALIFSEALTHGTLPWSGQHERRALLYKYCPDYMSWSKQYPLASDIEHGFTSRQDLILAPPYYEPEHRIAVVEGREPCRSRAGDRKTTECTHRHPCDAACGTHATTEPLFCPPTPLDWRLVSAPGETRRKGGQKDAAGPNDIIRSVQRASALLSAIAHSESPLTAAELAATVGLNVSTTYHLLNTLEVERLASRRDDRRYELGPQLLYLAAAVPAGILQQPGVITELEELHSECRETTYVCAWQANDIVVLAVRQGLVPRVVGGLGVGHRQDSHGATAKALLAFSEPERVERYLDGRVLSASKLEAFHGDLAEARVRGYAVDDGMFAEGVTCVSAPILGADGRPIAALSIAVPAEHFRTSAERLVAAVASAGRRASVRLGHRASAKEG